MDPTLVAVIAIVAAAGSEIITLLPMRENSWIQLLVKLLNVIAKKK